MWARGKSTCLLEFVYVVVVVVVVACYTLLFGLTYSGCTNLL